MLPTHSRLGPLGEFKQKNLMCRRHILSKSFFMLSFVYYSGFFYWMDVGFDALLQQKILMKVKGKEEINVCSAVNEALLIIKNYFVRTNQCIAL